jgi:peptidoglycan/xylan/chitin deacetylase (PgdA/CDA1 family)
MRLIVGMSTATACLVATQLAPALTAIPTIRRLAPALSGLGQPRHVALTFDDGPHPRSTPAFLRLLEQREVRATFFLLGASAARWPALTRELADAGHELAVHGWDHRCMALTSPKATYEGLARARDVIAEQTGIRPRWFRPSYGVLTAAAIHASRRLGLTPILWTNWGRDWTGRATASSVRATVTRGLSGGAVILLHDATGGHAAPGAWRATLAALPAILDHCVGRDLQVGRLQEHGIPRPRQERSQ